MNNSTWLDHLVGAYPFSVHMAEHMFLAQVIAPLVLLAVPVATARTVAQLRFARILVKLLRKHSLTWLVGMGGMWAWHLPAACHAVASHPGLQSAQYVSFFLSGTFFWWPIFSPLRHERMEPVPWAVLYLVSGCLGCTLLGILLAFAPVDFFYASSALKMTAPAITAVDQHTGGLIMWVPGCLIYLFAVITMFARWYNAPEDLRVPGGAVVSKSEMPS